MEEEAPRTGFAMDRDLQRALLERMREAYPDMIRGFPGRRPLSRQELIGLVYLQEHGLCNANITLPRPGDWAWGGAKITAAGLDFLEQDGGLTAILGVVTVKLHADTVRDLLEKKVDSSDLPPEKKSAIKEALRKLPGAALQLASTDLIKVGLEHAPDAMHMIGRLVGM